MLALRRPQVPAFLLFWSAVVATSFLITRSDGFAAHPDVLSLAVTLDLMVLVPAAYLVLARRMGWRLLTVVPVLVLTLVAANLVIPSSHQRWLDAVEFMLAPLELVLIVLMVRKVLAIRKDYRSTGATAEDFVETLEQVLTRAIGGGRPAKMVATEVAMIYYGLVVWRANPGNHQERRTFSYHRGCDHATITWLFIALILLETAVLHWFLLPRIPLLAWVLLALSLYGVVFLFADLGAARLRPIYLEGDTLVVRVALRWSVRIPLQNIARVETTTHDIEDKDGLLAAPLIGNQNVVLHLGSPATAHGMYGFTKEFRRISLAVDDLPAFVEAVACPPGNSPVLSSAPQPR